MAEISSKVLLTLSKSEPRGENQSYSVVRVVVWIIDGKPLKPKLERRGFFIAHNGEERMGKAEGFTKFDLNTIITHLEQVNAAMDGKAEPESAAAGEGEF